MSNEIRYKRLTASLLMQEGESFVDLADPLTAVALNLDACVRFLDRDHPSIEEVRRQLSEAVLQCSRAQEIYHRVNGGASLTSDSFPDAKLQG